MVDLIRTAYGFDPDKIVGGPSWLEMNRYDVAARVPADMTPDTMKLMLQSLLAERFGLKVHQETRPLPTYALTVGKKLQIKEADGTGDTGCRPQTGPAGAGSEGPAVVRIATTVNGVATTLNLGPGMQLQYSCRNVSMASFAEGLRGMMGVGAVLGTNPVRDETGLEGRWNFDVRWSMMGAPIAGAGDRVTVFDALDKQLGLKLEQRQVPTPVLVVDSASAKPTENAPGVAEALPPVPVATEFEVADVKPSDPGGRNSRFQIQPGGRLTSQGMPVSFLLMRAFNVNNPDEIVNLPKWAASARFDITAKAASAGAAQTMDMDALAPMMRSLLVDRFGLKYHTEERQMTAYSLVAGKPKMKKADPASRTFCRTQAAGPGTPPGSRALQCQNTTMAQLADRLLNIGQGLNFPILDLTGIEGGWDFTLTWSQNFAMAMPAGGGMVTMARRVETGPGGPAGPAGGGEGVGVAAEPVQGVSIFEAVEKQLGLKLEAGKRMVPVIVIDHLEEKPTEN